MPRYDDKAEGFGMLMEALATGVATGHVERAEAAGQLALVASEDLPIDLNGGSREEVERATGIRWGDPVNDLFVRVELPAGWRKERTDHSMWSKLLDDRGRERALIFYKAAFYDRSAHVSFLARYSVETENLDEAGEIVPGDALDFYERVQMQRYALLDRATTEIVRRSETFKHYRRADGQAERSAIFKAGEETAAPLRAEGERLNAAGLLAWLED